MEKKRRNCWVIPTDKPSRLHCYDWSSYGLSKEHLQWKQGRNIYITSDEEIKQGDWCIYNTGEVIHYLVKLNTDNLKKIILTTDQDLIQDGIQTIDDEFLEWFVKNPSCEKVEVYEVNGKLFAEPIIPKEEPKQETLEEAAETFSKQFLNNGDNSEFEAQAALLGVLYGAKWQAERMYSEEDMIEFHKWAFQKNRIEESDKTTKELLLEWFEQSKKKQ